MKPQSILLFADRLPPLIGGMEMHARYFIEYFSHNPRFTLSGVITKNPEGEDCLLSGGKIEIEELHNLFDPVFVFFNSGRWIERLELIRKIFPNASFIYRTGGNEILKASLSHEQIQDHSLRQFFWAEKLNSSIDLLITNSAYTETRLRGVGVTCQFARSVGGVNALMLKPAKLSNNTLPTIFCASRFVPYKNHSLLLSVISKLILRGNNFRLRLAGDGPLFNPSKELVLKYKLDAYVEFLGVIDNEKACQEIAQADIYLQLSSDIVTMVPGGSYVHSEGMGRSILEAISAGTFVIAGCCGALPEIVSESRGMLIALDNEELIANNIEPILRNLPIKLPFTDEFDWNKIFYGYEKLMNLLNRSMKWN
jgi:glycosyltransferase involved in cell wall biosynthesis